jgi:hypothetical protein
MLSVDDDAMERCKSYIHVINVMHMQVPLYQSRGMARGKFSNPLFTSGLFLGEAGYASKSWMLGF